MAQRRVEKIIFLSPNYHENVVKNKLTINVSLFLGSVPLIYVPILVLISLS